ncbi:serine protease [Actinoplanes sp. TRM 88003]|uniref:Serine protease n=1 Tax=Paractinoplanes aksuensis TaxID=2939490 RepID=A0ABT1DLC0_9ACTN|nr:trypsin-like peptidase domain-containing protein [Actinoplanes aksuensis]MCO8271604.1 serine protease [Actinoplanes aksuensis]
MSEPRWQARIDIPAAHRRGSGFLVDDRHVVTCEHVVRDHSRAQVTLGGDQARDATVLRTGPWWSPAADEADVAVLELDTPVRVDPAPLAPHAALEIYSGETLDAYGFPRSYEESGVYTSFHSGPQQYLGGDVQVQQAEEAFGPWLQEGFSGAAARHQNTQQVVGMVRKAARSERIGAIVPVAHIAEVCPALDGIIPLGTLTPHAYTELRAVVAAAKLPQARIRQLLTMMRAKVPSMPGNLSTLAGVVESLVVQTTMLDDDEMRYNLAGLLVKIGTAEARHWHGAHLYSGEIPTVVTEPAHEGAIVVKLEATAARKIATYDLKVWLVTDADGELGEVVAEANGLLPTEWRSAVESALHDAVVQMPLRVFTVEFVLPSDFLSEPVEDWMNLAEARARLGISRPVVVRDLHWFNHANPAGLSHRAGLLRDHFADLGDELRWRDHTEAPTTTDAFQGWLFEGPDGPLVIGLTCQWSAPEHVGEAVQIGPPVLIWRRGQCSPGDSAGHEACAGRLFAENLTDRLRGVTFDQVAHRIRELRAEAVASGDPTHCGSGLALLRDDARRRLVRLGFAAS